MTKIKNTKKGMAKKTLSMSLVVAMLATSNVPVWAAEFSDGTDAAVATEAPAAETFSDETDVAPVVDETETPAAQTVVNEGDITTDLSIKNKTIVWGDKTEVEGTVTRKDGTAMNWRFRWVDEAGVSQKSSEDGKKENEVKTVNAVDAMNFAPDKNLAGKTLTLHVYDTDVNDQILYDIDTKITVSVAKRSIKTVGFEDSSVKQQEKEYNGFSQSVDKTFFVTDEKGQLVTSDNYETVATSGKNAGDEITATVTAKADSPYIGSAEMISGKIVKRTLRDTDVIANTTKGQTYQYTGDKISIPKDTLTLKESTSVNGGEDGLLSGADLSAAIKNGTVTGTKVGEEKVSVAVDPEKFDNIDLSGTTSFKTEETVTITKRDLSTAGTKIAVKTLSGQIPTNISVDQLSDYLIFTGVEGTDLSKIKKSKNEYTTIVKNADGTDAKQFKNGSTYTVTVRAKDGGNCTGEQTFTVVATAAALDSVEMAAATPYTATYNGDEIKPSKSDLGTLKINYYNETGVLTSEELGSDAYEITGYTNNVNATKKYKTKNGSLQPVATAYVNIKITSGTYKDQTASVAFLINPLEVTSEYVTVPKNISINKTYTKASDYKVPVTVVAKDHVTGTNSHKIVKTLEASDYKVEYEFVDGGTKSATNGTAKNELHDYIKTTVTITNTNYIFGTKNGKTVTDIVAKNNTEITAKQLTDSMVVVTPSTYTYTGGKITPTYAVIDGAIALYKHGEVAEDKAEYEEVSITDAVNVGTGKITVRGYAKNDFYSGTATGTFTITAANTADVKVSIDNQKYTGKQVRPRDFKATLNGNDVSNQFEIVSYGENKEAGTGTIVLKPVDGNKNFTGSNITANFNIIKEEVSARLNVYDGKGFNITAKYTADVTADPKDGHVVTVKNDATLPFEFDGNTHTFAKALLSNIEKVTDDGVKTTAKASDFEIKYADNITGKKITEGKANIGYIYAVAKEGTGFAGTKTLVTSDGTVINNVVAYIPFSIKSVEFVSKNVSIKNATYAGGLPVKPEVLIQIGGSTLVEGKDYTLKLKGKDSKGKVIDVTPTDVTVGNIYAVEITGINGYTGSSVYTYTTNSKDTYAKRLTWGVDKKNLKDCNVTVKDGVVTVLNGYLPVASTEYTATNNGDGTYTVSAVSTSKNYTGSITVTADGKAENEKPNAPMINSVKVTGNKATVILSGESEGAAGYDYVISTDRDCITNKDYTSVNKNQVKTNTTFEYVGQNTYYAYCHAWKRDENGKKVFSDWSNAYPFVVSAITPSQPVITSVKVSGSTVTVTYTKASNANGYDVVLGTSAKKVNGETRPVEYGKLVKKNIKGNVVTATFKNVKKGTYYAGLHAFNRTSEDGKKVFSQWSNVKKVNVK